jgi:prepilin-type N-terminal cleavage/methylation domain-containing protein
MIQRLQAKRNEEGFTLIELLIVIIVLGILAAIVVFAVGSTRKDSVASSCKTNYKSVELSAEAINTKSGTYPTGIVTANFPATNPLLASTTSTNGALLKAWPTPAGADYEFQYSEIAAVGGATPTAQSFKIDVWRKGTTFDPTTGVALGTGGATPTSVLATDTTTHTGVDACTNLG